MKLLGRIRRKIQDVAKYPRLAWQPADRRELLLLGLVRNRVPLSRLAARAATDCRRAIAPRIAPARGERVRVGLDCPFQIDVFDELFLDVIYDLSAVRFAPELVVDCGAFCGYFSALAAGHFPAARLVCFEANPDNLPMLRAQLEILSRRVELNAAAVHVRDGVVPFSGSGMGGRLGEGDPQASHLVPCVDFPRWLSAQAPASLVCKLDVEGAELELLPQVVRHLPRKTALFLETHHSDPTCEALLAPYRGAGFSVREVRRRQAGAGDLSYTEWRLMRGD